ncbi:MAG: DUF3108 domain-containing protein [Rhodoferax sp.]
MKRVDTVLSFRLMALLVVAVLLVHLVLLQTMVISVGPPPSPSDRFFSTRSIEFVPAVAPPQRRSVKTAAQAPVRPAPVQIDPVPAAAEPAADPAGEAAAAPQAGSVAEGNSGPDKADVSQGGPSAAEQMLPAPRSLREQTVSAGAYAVPGSVTLKYRVTSNKFPFSLNAELAWRRMGESYDARLSAGAFGIGRVQTSRGQITDEGLMPLRFSDKYRSEVAAHFVREQGKIIFSVNTPEAPLLAGAQDRLSIVVQLAAMIAGDPGRFPAASTIAVQIVGPRDADTWLFTVEEDELLTLPGGQQATRKLVRNPRREFDQKVELWLAPALGYLPARIRITESNGDYIDQQWLASEPQA